MFDNTDLPLALIMEEFIFGKTDKQTDAQPNGENTGEDAQK